LKLGKEKRENPVCEKSNKETEEDINYLILFLNLSVPEVTINKSLWEEPINGKNENHVWK
jgi:hypothetical protein